MNLLSFVNFIKENNIKSRAQYRALDNELKKEFGSNPERKLGTTWTKIFEDAYSETTKDEVVIVAAPEVIEVLVDEVVETTEVEAQPETLEDGVVETKIVDPSIIGKFYTIDLEISVRLLVVNNLHERVKNSFPNSVIESTIEGNMVKILVTIPLKEDCQLRESELKQLLYPTVAKIIHNSDSPMRNRNDSMKWEKISRVIA